MDICFFLGDQKRTEKVAIVEGGLFTASCRGVLLLSSPKEVSKKGATVSTRWTPTRGNPWTPHSGTLTGCYPHRLLPGPPCGPGVQVLPQREKKLDRANGLQRKEFSLPPPPKTFHPACKVRPGAAGGEMAELLSWAGVQRISSSGRRPPVRKGGAFLGSSFGDERRITSRLAAGTQSTTSPKKLSCFFFRKRKKNPPRLAAGKIKTQSANSKNERSLSHGKTKGRPGPWSGQSVR